MSVAAIRSGVVAILVAAGAKNVAAESTASLEGDAETRMDGDRVHFWRVRAGRTNGIGGAGYIDRRHVFTMTGFLGVARDGSRAAPSDATAADLLDAVVAALEAPENARPGSCLERSGEVVAQPIRIDSTVMGQESVPVHVLVVQATYTEAN